MNTRIMILDCKFISRNFCIMLKPLQFQIKIAQTIDLTNVTDLGTSIFVHQDQIPNYRSIDFYLIECQGHRFDIDQKNWREEIDEKIDE